MKTEIELLGFEIEVKEEEGKVLLQVEKDDEIVEEITLDPSEYENEEGEDVKDFDSFEGEGEEGEELPEDEDDDNEDEDEDEDDDNDKGGEDVLESFDKWTKKNKK